MLPISEAAARSGLTASTIRYYEDEGLLNTLPYRKAGRRFYDAAAVAELALLHDLRRAGMTVADLKQFQAARQNSSATCAELATLASERAKHLRTEILALRHAEARLMGFAQSCQTVCGTSPTASCSQFNRLSAVV